MEERKTVKNEVSAQEEALDLNAPVSVHLHRLGAQDFKEQFLEDHFHCCLCGDELELTHVAHFVQLEVTEEAHCPSCRVRTRTVTHRLQ
jgi:hypothetical protein